MCGKVEEICDVLPVEQDLAARGFQELGQQVEAGRLAGPVGTDQRVDGAALHLEVDVVDGHEALELLDQSTGFQNDLRTHVSDCFFQMLRTRHYGGGVPAA